MKLAIVGFGREGQSLLSFLKSHPKYQSAEFWVLDRNHVEVPPSVSARTGEGYLSNLEEFDIIFRSPGIPYNLPEFIAARKKGVKFSSATKLFFELAPKKTENIIGITGSKGKTTTATLLYDILKAAKKSVYLRGNVGESMLDLIPKLRKNTWVILELSSFQLQDLERSPHLAVVLETFPEHLDAHKNLKEYYDAKSQVCRHQKKSDTVFYFTHNAVGKKIAATSSGKKVAVGEKNFDLFRPEELHTIGLHNYRNLIMAATVATHAGIFGVTIRKAVLRFKGIPHRLEPVHVLYHADGEMVFINDSMSTNPHTTARAAEAFHDTPHILIAGGYDKNLDYAPLAETLKASKNTRFALIYGQNRAKILRTIEGAGIPVRLAANLEEAVRMASEIARKIQGKSVILFSPGAASFDMFKDYKERGERFVELVRQLT